MDKDKEKDILAGKSGKEKDELQNKLQELEKQKSEYLSGWQRERADFLNYKKEEMERITELLKYSKEELLMKFLPIMDNFDVIENNFPDLMEKDGSAKGFMQIKEQLRNFFKNQGVEEIKSVGETFDPHLHEVVEEIESKDKEQKTGIIVEEVQKGYTINGKLLRPARVKVIK